MGNIVLHLKLIRGMQGTLLAYVVQNHVKVAHISPGYGAFLKLDNEMIARAPIINAKMNLKLSQNSLVRIYQDYQCDTFNINNASVY